MRLLSFLAVLLLSFTSCAPSGISKRRTPPLPPGVERGMIWEEAADYGYSSDIYITPDYVADAKKGSRSLLYEVRKTYKKNTCKNGRHTY